MIHEESLAALPMDRLKNFKDPIEIGVEYCRSKDLDFNPDLLHEVVQKFNIQAIYYNNILIYTSQMTLSPFKDSNGNPIGEGSILRSYFDNDGVMGFSDRTVYFCTATGQWLVDVSFHQNRQYSEPLHITLSDGINEVI